MVSSSDKLKHNTVVQLPNIDLVLNVTVSLDIFWMSTGSCWDSESLASLSLESAGDNLSQLLGGKPQIIS